MNLFFWKPAKEIQKPREPRKFEIAPEDMLEFCKLEDEFEENGKIGRNVIAYRLWKFVQDRFPDVAQGKWSIKHSHATRAYIVEEIPEDK